MAVEIDGVGVGNSHYIIGAVVIQTVFRQTEFLGFPGGAGN